MPWQESFDLLCDTQLLLRRVADAIEQAYEASTVNVNTNMLLVLEFDELIISLNELVEEYTINRFANRFLCAKIQFFIFNLRESVAIAAGQHITWLSTHYTFCKRIIYSSEILYNSIERESDRLQRKGKK